MNGYRREALRVARTSGWIDAIAAGLIQHAGRNVPDALCGRLEEEWLAGMWEQPGRLSRLQFSLGCCWAAMMITRDHFTMSLPPRYSDMRESTMTGNAYRRTSLFPSRETPATGGAVLCEINTTPLIDVMLVLLVTLIIALPIMAHAVKLNLPQAPPSPESVPPEVIDLDIEFDGAAVWNGTPVGSLPQLESYLRAEARKDPQPEIHLRADRHVKYDFVARILALAQHNGLKKMGVVGTAEFKD